MNPTDINGIAEEDEEKEEEEGGGGEEEEQEQEQEQEEKKKKKTNGEPQRYIWECRRIEMVNPRYIAGNKEEEEEKKDVGHNKNEYANAWLYT